jgi:hypothetical protein
MNPDAEFDRYLASQLDEVGLPDEGFTRAVAARMERYRRRRRLAVAGAVVVSTVIAAIAAYFSPIPVFVFPNLTPDSIVAAMVLVTACSFVWIGTASRPTTRPMF